MHTDCPGNTRGQAWRLQGDKCKWKAVCPTAWNSNPIPETYGPWTYILQNLLATPSDPHTTNYSLNLSQQSGARIPHPEPTCRVGKGGRPLDKAETDWPRPGICSSSSSSFSLYGGQELPGFQAADTDRLMAPDFNLDRALDSSPPSAVVPLPPPKDFLPAPASRLPPLFMLLSPSMDRAACAAAAADIDWARESAGLR